MELTLRARRWIKFRKWLAKVICCCATKIFCTAVNNDKYQTDILCVCTALVILQANRKFSVRIVLPPVTFLPYFYTLSHILHDFRGAGVGWGGWGLFFVECVF